MTNYKKGEVYLANVIFTDGSEVKKRFVRQEIRKLNRIRFNRFK